MTKINAINWFELFASDFDRAVRFYETILDSKLERMTSCTTGAPLAIFSYERGKGVGGSITKMDGCTPGAGGTIAYLNVEGELDAVLSRIWNAGGTVVKPRFAIGGAGFIALFKDTEGNLVGLHSMV